MKKAVQRVCKSIVSAGALALIRAVHHRRVFVYSRFIEPRLYARV
jgi:hypothetical protein